MINFIFISSVINVFNYFGDFSVTLPLLVVLTATVIAKISAKNNLWEILFITFFLFMSSPSTFSLHLPYNPIENHPQSLLIRIIDRTP